MMKLCKIAGDALPDAGAFAFSDRTVQGARLGRAGDSLYIFSPRRFKLFAEGRDEVVIVRGAGHIKWARGELPFRAGEHILAEECGEYEINGDCEFAVLRNR